MKHSLIFVVAAVLATCALARGKSVDAELEALVASERAFAAASKAKGMRTAFVAYLATDSVIFRPRAVPGKQWWEQQADLPGRLTCTRLRRDLAGGDDVGYTQDRRSSAKARPRQDRGDGYFFSIWKRQADALGKGFGHGHPTPAPSQVPRGSRRAKPGRPVGFE